MRNRKVVILLTVLILLAVIGVFLYINSRRNSLQDLTIKDPVNQEVQDYIDSYCKGNIIKGINIILDNNKLLIDTEENGSYTISLQNGTPVITLVRAFSIYDRAEIKNIKPENLPSVNNKTGACVVLNPTAAKSSKDIQPKDIAQIIIY